NFSRTSGTEFVRIDLNQLVHDTAILLEHQFKTAQIRIESDLSPDLAPVKGNQGKLQQVILNLMLNARDAMHGAPDSRIRIRTYTADGNAIVEISDTGAGIDPTNL